MNKSRQVPPVIEGYTPIRLVGRGGFADVFAYQQRTPRRVVAVKVLAVPDDDDIDHIAAFEAEANYLADLSQHPAIVTVHDAGTSLDGRPYIIMEYCSRPGFGAIYRHQRLGVAEVLRVGVRLSSAVETAHRAGVLHRDIKPANVLLTDYGWPALADFGIAVATGSEGVAAVSMAWAAPEALLKDRVDVRSDVYSLGATLYALLAQRSPFEIVGGSNAPYDLLARVERGRPPRVGRPDVPARLEAVLARALSTPEARYPSAADLGRALQQVEAELALPVTELDLAERAPAAGWADSTLTRSRLSSALAPNSTLAPNSPLAPNSALAPNSPLAPHTPDPQPVNALEPWQATRVRAVSDLNAFAPPGTVEEATSESASSPVVRRRRRTVVGTVAAAVATIAVGTALAVSLMPREGEKDPVTTPTVALPIGTQVPAPINLVAERSVDLVIIRWDNPQPEPGDSFAWSRTDSGAPSAGRTITSATSLTLEVPSDTRVCVDVLLVRKDGSASTPGSLCDDGA